MPELPEVETMCRGIHGTIGRTILSVSRPPCAYRPISIQPPVASIDRALQGKTITRISRLGKRVLIHAAKSVLVLQPKMTGLVSLESPPDPDHIRLRIDFDCGAPLLFWDRRGLGTVEFLPESEIEDRLISGRLGPDALSITESDFSNRLAKCNRPIKVALLDQKILAGVGNLYASEMLFAAKINPARLASKIGRKRKKALHAAMLTILNDAIKHEGSTLSDGTYRNALNDPGSYQNQHLVYDHAGDTCPRCHAAEIRRIVQAQRSTFYCPRCQRN